MKTNIQLALIYSGSVSILFICKYQVNRQQYVNKAFLQSSIFLIHENNIMR